MVRSVCLCPLLLAILLAASPPGAGQAGMASAVVRETVEMVTRKFAKEAAEESTEALTQKVATAAEKYGKEGLLAFGKVGPRTFTKVIVEAGEHAPAAVKLTAKYGDEAVWVIAKPRGMAIFIKYGEPAATAVMKHPGIAEEVVESLGMPAARALNTISTSQARRLGMLLDDGTLRAAGRPTELLDAITKYGDAGMDFVWNHKGALTVAATLATFLNDPAPFIQGGKELVAEVAKPVAMEITRSTHWTPVFVIGLLTTGGLLALRFRQRDSQP